MSVPRKVLSLQDEVEQILDPTLAAAELRDEADRERLLKLLRRLGHMSNEANDYDAAHMAFDCAHSLAHQMADLLSAANMRLKLLDTSPVSEALYTHALTELDLPEREQVMVESKLQQIRENKQAASVEHGAQFV